MKAPKWLAGVFHHLIALGVVEALKLVVTAAVLALLARLLSTTIEALKPYALIVWLLVFGGGGLLALVLRRRFSRMTPRFTHLTFDFDVLEKCVTYTYQDGKPVLYTKRCKLRARRDGLEEYKDKYSWTGRGDKKIRSLVGGQEFKEDGRRNVWELYRITFGKVLNKGETIETMLAWDLDDREGVAVPFVSADIEEPTHLLILRLEFKGSGRISKVIADESHTIGVRGPYNNREMTVSPDGVVEWAIHNPRLLQHYELHWTQ